jgi:hypothetical protein
MIHFKNFTRMSREDFAILLKMIKPKIMVQFYVCLF